MSLITAIGLFGLVISPATAFWRLPCESPIVVERADPIVNPGKVSGHVHTIMGGNAFDFEMSANQTLESTCSSCTVIGDKSNYWVPTLFYQGQDGTFESVDQVGGATVYYLQRAGDGETLHAFPPGFRMLAGDPNKRAGGSDFASQAISYHCLDYSGNNYPETGYFPTMNCPSGIRAQVFFPSCWNGKDLDSPDHKSHMSYPVGAYNSGSCPPDYPVHLVSLFYEVIWDTTKFANRWYGNGQPFVWSQGDPTGYGLHADFIMGWEGDILQRAVDQCTADSGRVEDCPVFSLIPDGQAAGCMIAPKVNEQVTGKLNALPGCNPIQAGPGEATPQSGCGATTAITASSGSFFKDLTSQGWSYTGCGTDNPLARTLNGATQTSDDMTIEKCVAYCSNAGFSVAGVEYSTQCFCDNSIPMSGAPVKGVIGACVMPCGGDSTEYCGGSGAIGLYTKCTGGSCTNADLGLNLGTSAVSASGSNSGSSGSSGSGASSSSRIVTSSSVPTTMATVAVTSAAAAQTSTAPASSSSQPTSSSSSGVAAPVGWTYKGCYKDALVPRALAGWQQLNDPSMTIIKCTALCVQQGYSLAGVEYGDECFCANSNVGTLVADSDCNESCSGENTQMCGGFQRISVFAKGTGSGAKCKRDASTYEGPRRHVRPRRMIEA